MINGSSIQGDAELLSAYLHNNTVVKYTREKWIELQGETDESTIILKTSTPSIKNDEYQQDENKKSHK